MVICETSSILYGFKLLLLNFIFMGLGMAIVNPNVVLPCGLILVHLHFIWCIRTDSNISIIRDPWVDSILPIDSPTYINIGDISAVDKLDWFIILGVWNVDKLDTLFPSNIMTHIFKIPIVQGKYSDQIYWHHTQSALFSLRRYASFVY